MQVLGPAAQDGSFPPPPLLALWLSFDFFFIFSFFITSVRCAGSSSSSASSTTSTSLSSFSSSPSTASPSHSQPHGESSASTPSTTTTTTSTNDHSTSIPTSLVFPNYPSAPPYDPDSDTPGNTTHHKDNDLVDMYFLVLGAILLALAIAFLYWRKGHQRKLLLSADRRQNALQQDLELGGWRRVGGAGGGGWLRGGERRRRGVGGGGGGGGGEEGTDERGEAPPPYTATGAGAGVSGGAGGGGEEGDVRDVRMPPAVHVRDEHSAGGEQRSPNSLPKYDDLIRGNYVPTPVSAPRTPAIDREEEEGGEDSTGGLSGVSARTVEGSSVPPYGISEAGSRLPAEASGSDGGREVNRQ